jgi:hypothetical protein
MHVGSIGIFDPGQLARADLGIDFEQVLRVAEAGLFRAPRFRDKLAVAPLSGHRVWVVGAHVLGGRGIPTLLRSAGHRVERVGP